MGSGSENPARPFWVGFFGDDTQAMPEWDGGTEESIFLDVTI